MYQILVFLFLFAGITCGSFNSDSYANSQVLIPLDYTVYWNVDLANNQLHLALRVKTTGFVGFGIGEPTSGSMPGADIMVGYVINGKGSVEDRWSYDRVEPALDDCQDVTLVNAEESEGYTVVEVTRPINTSDPQDRSIAYGPNRVIASFGQDDTLAYHGSDRTTSEITFFGGPLYSTDPVPGETTLDLLMDNFVIPNAQTVYACQAFTVPTDQDYTITQIDPIVDEANVAHVHHFLAHVCVNQSLVGGTPLVQKYMNNPTQCSTPLGNVPEGCTGILSAWAAGGGSSYAPPEAGFAMGIRSTSIKFIILEVHYNNPDGNGGYTDNSGIRIHYSTTPRLYEADVMTLGDPFVLFSDIPADSVKEYEAECHPDCTAKFPWDINVFQSFPHMHQVGSRIWTTQWRDGEQINEFGRVEFWTFNHQLQTEVNFTIKQGDRLNTHCVYDTTSSGSAVSFGIASTQEMCMHFISYYPRIFTNITLVHPPETVPYSFCGNFLYGESICGSITDQVDIPNPKDIDPPGGANRTFGVAPSDAAQCLAAQEKNEAAPLSPFLSSLMAILLTYFIFVFLTY